MTQSVSNVVAQPDYWFEANREYLIAFVEYAKYLLKTSYSEFSAQRTDAQCCVYEAKIDEARDNIPGVAALDYLAELYGLSEFEKNILLLCVAPELDSSFLYPLAPEKPVVVNFSLALATFVNADWSAITTSGTLRSNGLLHVDDGPSLTASKIHVPESILHFIVGVAAEDASLQLISEDYPVAEVVLDNQNTALLDNLYDIWISRYKLMPAVYTLTGEHAEIKRDIAAALSRKVGIQLKVLPAFFIPTELTELKRFVVSWNREITLNNYLLFIDCDSQNESDQYRERLVDYFIDKLDWPIICSNENKRQYCNKEQYAFEVNMPGMHDQKAYWKSCLKDYDADLDADINEVCSHFDLSFRDIQSFSLAYKSLSHHDSIWNVCRRFSKQKMGNLAEKIEPAQGALNLILPHREKTTLDEIVAHVKLRATVYDEWGFLQNSIRGRGVTVLFAGASGTGKTTAAEYLALKLALDLYRIDLSNIVSKYIGETEKNLQQIFHSAEKSGAILLFDEADALFGKRTQVKDSHDKHANSGVSYLLQRMESFRGLAILTSNLKDSFDKAFIRRLRFIVQFPFPSAEERGKIWQTMLPQNAPAKEIDFSKLSQLNVAGGSIRNITMNACFSAAAENEAVQMKHYLTASRSEYEKLEKHITAEEVNGWV
jgi:ATPase family protein associated with various cellular activities (AAA)/winged helix domain-containing protein